MEPEARRKRARGTRDLLWISLAGVSLFAVRRRLELGREMALRAEAEAALEESEERYRSVVELSPDAILVHSEERLVFANAAAARLLGARSADELVGKPALEIVHPDYRDIVSERIRSEIEEGKTVPLLEEKFVRLDGRVIDVEVAGIPLTYRGKPAGQVVVRDVTDRKLAEQQLRESEARYRSLVENIPGIVYIDPLDREPAVPLFVSPQTETVLGFSQEEWMDPTLWIERLHPDDRDRAIAQSDRSDETGERFRCEYRLMRRDGSVVWVRDESVLVRDDEGASLFWQGFMLDITERKQAEEQLRETEARYRVLVEHIPAVLYVDRAVEGGTMPTYVSPQVERVLGLTQADWLGDAELWRRYLHPEDAQRAVGDFLAGVASERPFSLEYRLVRPDGRLIWCHEEAVVLPGDGGRPTIVEGVISDVTERKFAEEALQESERREREAADRLRVLDDMKNTFLAAVSHELRSPLTSILGLALTLERSDLTEEDRVDLLGRLASNARKLDRLLKDLLDIDRLNRGIVEPQYRDTDVGALARRALNSLELPEDRSILVEADPVVVPVDPAKVERIVENLVANAFRHTDTDVGIWVRVRAEDGGVLLAVEDDGPGVPPELWHDIFAPFRQGPTASPHAPGTGIGLSLVARFAELHGGRAWVQEREGGGASFRVFLPSAIPSGNVSPVEGAAGEPGFERAEAG
ncbi:MAG: sensor histidine kinase [Actinomycetota bacterium]